jgi:hypothetical protein
MHQVVLVRIADAKPRCMHIISCDDKMALVQDFGIVVADTGPGYNGPPVRYPLTQIYQWHEVQFGLLLEAFLGGKTAALTAMWQDTPRWQPCAPAWKPYLIQ